LRSRATPAQSQALENGLRRLLDPGEMGELFKAVAITSPSLPTPAGFGATAYG
jgi:NADH dehydrogenase [ubiquinone] 1 alpha subcomplex assembly factor 7